MKNTKGEVSSKLKISVSRKEGRIRIGNGVIKVLGNPEYICIYVFTYTDALMVRPCEKKEFLSIKVTKNDNVIPKNDLRVNSLQFVSELYFKNGWNTNGTYQMQGVYNESLNATVFYYKNAVLMQHNKDSISKI